MANDNKKNTGKSETMRELPYVCVHCGSPSASLYRQLSVSVSSIQTTTCSSCGKTVDPYAEREWLLVAIDCILLREEAYRHVLYNVDELKGLAVRKYFHFLLAWSILDTYLKWETMHTDYAVEGGPVNLHDTASLVSMGGSSALGMLIQWLAIVSFLSYARSPAKLPTNLPGKVFLALLLPCSFSVVTIIVMIWENTKTVRLLGSVLMAYWQGIAVSVISNDIYTPLVGMTAAILWRLAVSTFWIQPYPCAGLEVNHWEGMPSICVT